MMIRNLTNGSVLAQHAEVATSMIARLVGLLGRPALPEGCALIFPRCRSIHTWFMRYPIDVVFVDTSGTAQGVVTKAIERLRPFRLTGTLKADTVVELPPGMIERTLTRCGQQLGWEP